MSQPLLGEGEYVEDVESAETDRLRDEIADLKQQLHQAQGEVLQLKRANAKAIGNLRQQLTPLYRALQGVFGEIESIGGAVEETGRQLDGRTKAVWESWKSKLGGSRARVIDALLLHNELNTQQLAIAVGMHRTSIPQVIYDLNKAGLINKNGGKFSLKQL